MNYSIVLKYENGNIFYYSGYKSLEDARANLKIIQKAISWAKAVILIGD